jgi:acetyl-CoA C-acetyltransferase
LYQGLDPWRAVAVFDLPDGRRTVAYSEAENRMQEMLTRECCGAVYQVADGRFQ